MLNNIAVLLTCFNRKNKTLECLNHLNLASEPFSKSLKIDVYLTDDSSSDGTYDAVKKEYPDVTLLKGNGSLFWANGMINSWQAALKKDYDGYLLLNDDTYVFDNLFHQIIEAHEYCLEKYKRGGVYVGSTYDKDTNKHTYGGSIFKNWFWYRVQQLIPNGEYQECHLGNANILFASKEAVDTVGILSNGYLHGVADYDYTLKCVKKKVPVLVLPEYAGFCKFDHKSLYYDFEKKSLRERISYLYSPLGIDFKSRLMYMKKFFPYRYPFFFIVGWFKVFFPSSYKFILKRK
ncbi:glycosyltransferase family 2 protein [Flagellimonas sp. GZD32]|uniref:glycosyltransferase family 2 protein n=1 Tax=Flagellimonas cixiensis TaxID=3228750 RepID=UPI0035C87ED3